MRVNVINDIAHSFELETTLTKIYHNSNRNKFNLDFKI